MTAVAFLRTEANRTTVLEIARDYGATADPQRAGTTLTDLGAIVRGFRATSEIPELRSALGFLCGTETSFARADYLLSRLAGPPLFLDGEVDELIGICTALAATGDVDLAAACRQQLVGLAAAPRRPDAIVYRLCALPAAAGGHPVLLFCDVLAAQSSGQPREALQRWRALVANRLGWPR